MRHFLYKWMLPKLIARLCESIIDRSGEEGERENCYVVTLLDEEGNRFFIAKGLKNEIFTGIVFDKQFGESDFCVKLADFEKGDLNIVHYYGLAEVRYKNIYDVVFHYITRVIYLKIHLYWLACHIDQYLFNRRSLISKKRMELLKLLIDDQLKRSHDGISSLDLMTRLYSEKWVLHPLGDWHQKKLELYLNSFEKSGDIEKINNEYVVTGQAITTFELYEETERKHNEVVRLQIGMIVLTLFLALTATVQTGLIKLPTLFDLSKGKSDDTKKEMKNHG